jgi:S-adenosylmethionine decarboxylase
METKSQQLMMDIWLDQSVEPIVQKISDLVDNSFTVLRKTNHKFDPQGETIAFILSESHFTVHTYPEHNYLSLDIYICNMNIDLELVKDKILKICNPIKEDSRIILRGHGTGIK